jgi:hypothetical protein
MHEITNVQGYSFIHSLPYIHLTGASQGCGDSHNIIHNISVELQTHNQYNCIKNLHNKLSIHHAISYYKLEHTLFLKIKKIHP